MENQRTEEQKAKAIASIAKFEKENRDIDKSSAKFSKVALNPYVSGCRTMEIYETDEGVEYWIDTRTNEIIQSAPSAGQPPVSYKVKAEVRLPIAELRVIAHDIMTQQGVLSFKGFYPMEDNRNREVYFFRLDDSETKVSESELPPFIQVGLRADGKLVSYTNILKG